VLVERGSIIFYNMNVVYNCMTILHKFNVLVVLLIILISASVYTALAGTGDYEIHDDTVYVNMTAVNLSATPHTIASSGWVYFNLTSNIYWGNFDAAWGFNTSECKPTKAELYAPHWVNTTSQHSKTFYNVSSFSPYAGTDLDYGNVYNTNFSFAAVHEVTTYNESTMEPNGTVWVTSNASFDSFVNDAGNYTIYWHDRHDTWTLWKDKTSTFNSITHDYQGFDKWYYITDVSVVGGQSYLLRAWVDVPVSLEPTSGKYYFAVKPSSKTISEAINDGHFYALDPWWNSSWNYYKTITPNQTMINQSIGDVHYTMLVEITDTDLRDHAQADGDDIVFTDSANSTQLDHQISSYNSTTGYLKAYVNVTDISNVTSINMYYNNSGATDTQDKAGTWGVNASGIWLMDEGTGNYANDSSGNGNNGTIVGADWVADGLDFVAAKSDYVDCGNNILNTNNEDFTIIVKTSRSSGVPNGGGLVSKDPDGGTNRNWFLSYGYDNLDDMRIRLYETDGSPYGYSSTDNIFPVDTIVNLGFIVDVKNHKLYRIVDNTILDVTGSWDGTVKNEALPIHVGRVYSSVFDYDGLIANVMIYNRALSPDEVATSYNNTEYPSLFISVGTEQSDTPTDPASAITSYQNNKTLNDTLDFTINTSESVLFNATANQTITTWNWYKDTADQSHNYDNITLDWSTQGLKHVVVNATNTNGTSNSITWNVTVEIPPTFSNESGIWHFWDYENIPELHAAINDEAVLEYNVSEDIYTFHEPFYQNESTDIFYFNETVHLKSNVDSNPAYFQWNGTNIINNSIVLGWNTNTDTVATTVDYTRAYMLSDNTASGNITNSNISYLGGYIVNKTGIVLNSYDGQTIDNNTFSNSYYGISGKYTINCIFTNNSALDNSYGFIFQSVSTNNNFSDNYAYSNSQYGFYITGSDNNTLYNNSAYENGYYGLSLSSSDYTNITNNSFYNNTEDGMDIATCLNSIVSSNEIYDNGYWGVYICSSSSNNTFSDNNISNNGREGFYTSASSNNIFKNNTVDDDNGAYYDYHFRLNSENNTVTLAVKVSNNFSVDNTIDSLHFTDGTNYTVGYPLTATVIQDNPPIGTENANITVISGTIDWINVTAGLSATTNYSSYYSMNDTEIEQQTTDGSGIANFTTNLLTGTYYVNETIPSTEQPQEDIQFYFI